MSKPLVANSRRNSESSAFHRAVFDAWGHKCYFGWNHQATDAAHIIPRSRLGKQRYACAKMNGRPVCRRHHEAQEAGLIDFTLADRRRAVVALNKVLKDRIQEPAA